MGSNKQYDGYEPYAFLEPGIDYETFEFSEEMNAGGPPYEVPLDGDEEARADRLASSLTIFSMHEHAFHFVPKNPSQLLDYVSDGRTFTAYEYLARSNLDGLIDFHLDGLARIHSDSGWKFSEVVHDMGMRGADFAHQDFVIRAGSVEDVRRAHDEGKLAIVPGAESSTMIENEVDRLDVLYGLGLRVLGISYNASNDLGTGLGDMRPHDGGLTRFGERAVERMNKLGIAVSVSHASDQTGLDVCEISDDPVFLTHDGVRELLGTDRLKPDEVIEAVADTGGVIGVQSAPHATASYDHPEHTIESVMDHFEYVKELVGIDHVAFGPDTLYGDHRELHKQFIPGVPDAAVEIDYVKGMENPTEAWHNIVRWLVKEGYSDEAIAKVTGENALRAVGEVWE